MYYVIDRDAGEALGCLRGDEEVEYTATADEVAEAAESSHNTHEEALAAALASGDNRWIIDPDGNTEWVDGSAAHDDTDPDEVLIRFVVELDGSIGYTVVGYLDDESMAVAVEAAAKNQLTSDEYSCWQAACEAGDGPLTQADICGWRWVVLATESRFPRLLVATLQGGDVEHDYNRQAIWLDCEGANGKWRALVASQSDAEDLAENTGAELLEVQQWDGSPFGDGNAGTVECRSERVLLVEHPEFVDPPSGWTVEKGEE